MFDNLQDKMDRVFKTLRGEAALNEWHIDNALKEIRVALLEADVHFKVVKQLLENVKQKALGAEVLGVDLSADVSDDTIAAIRAAWLEHLR